MKWLFVFLPLLLTQCADFTDRQQPPVFKGDHTIIRNVTYTPKDWPAPILSDLYLPKKSKKPSPAVLLIHGGGWTGKDGRWQMDPIAKRLAARGYVVLNITYRLAPKWRYPAPIHDSKEAFKWLRNNAAQYHIDPDRIATFGYSAGGYLAAFVGVDQKLPVKAVVAGGAPVDLTFYPAGDLVPQFLGGTQRQILPRFIEASPINHVTPQSPPFFLYHASKDRLVRVNHPQAMVHILRRNQVPHEIYWIKNRDHVEAYLLPSGAITRAIDFLDAQMLN